MACNSLINLIQSTCENNSGGILTAYIFPMEDIATFTEDALTWNVTALTLSVPAVNFEFRRNTSNFTEDAATDLVNGSSFVNSTLNFVFHRRDAAKSKALKTISDGQRYLGVVIGDSNGKYWYFPYSQVTTIGDGSGTARGDGSKYSVTLIAENTDLAKETTGVIAAALLV
jgi:hypothetical protein